MRSFPRGLLGLILPLLLAPAAAAQTVTGTFTDGETGEPIAGGVVVLLDEAGERVAGAITTSLGHYRVRAPVAGRYRLEGRMLGYRTVSPRPFVLAEGARMRWDLQTITDPIEMDGVTAEVASRCRARPDATGEAQRLWDLAKTTLTAVALTENAERIRFVAQTFEREINASARLVVREEVDSARAVRTHPFRSVPVDALLSKGFVDQAGDTVVYYAPDAGTLLSEAFLATHCFRAVEGESGRVGLAFEPIPERRGLSEIEGALWLDPETGGLEMLEFDYVHMPRAPWPYDFGGQVEYERLGNGAWIVGRWLLRLPQPMSSETWVPTHLGRRVRFGVAGSAGVREVGGEVLEVAGIGTHSLFEAPAGSVEGRLVSESGRPIEDALVYLSGTARSDSTDAQGRFRLDGVREGRYSLAWYYADGPRRRKLFDARTVTVRAGDTVRWTLTVTEADGPLADSARPPATPGAGGGRVLRRVPAASAGEGENAREADDRSVRVIGRVVDGDRGEPIADATVRLDEMGPARVTDHRGRVFVDDVPAGTLTLRVIPSDSGLEGTLVSPRTYCTPAVYVDGRIVVASADAMNVPAAMNEVYSAVNLARPTSIEAMELYSGVLPVPPGFRQGAGECGVVGIWTRRERGRALRR